MPAGRRTDGYTHGRCIDDRAAVMSYAVAETFLVGEYLCPDITRRTFLCATAATCGQKGHEGEKCCFSHVALFFKFQSFPFDNFALPGKGFYRYLRPLSVDGRRMFERIVGVFGLPSVDGEPDFLQLRVVFG